MNAFHVMIAIERRKQTPSKPNRCIHEEQQYQETENGPVLTQIHTNRGIRFEHPEDANILYAASWDLVSPWIVLLKGDRSVLKMGYLGWPTVTQAEWQAANPVVTP